MSHDAAYEFLRLGQALERADMTTRVLGVRAAALMAAASAPDGDGEHAEVQWMSVLALALGAADVPPQHPRAGQRPCGRALPARPTRLPPLGRRAAWRGWLPGWRRCRAARRSSRPCGRPRSSSASSIPPRPTARPSTTRWTDCSSSLAAVHGQLAVTYLRVAAPD